MNQDVVGVVVCIAVVLLFIICFRDLKRKLQTRYEINKLTSLFDERRSIHMAIRRHEHEEVIAQKAFHAEYIKPLSGRGVMTRELTDLLAHLNRWETWSKHCLFHYERLLGKIEEKIHQRLGEM